MKTGPKMVALTILAFAAVVVVQKSYALNEFPGQDALEKIVSLRMSRSQEDSRKLTILTQGTNVCREVAVRCSRDTRTAGGYVTCMEAAGCGKEPYICQQVRVSCSLRMKTAGGYATCMEAAGCR